MGKIKLQKSNLLASKIVYEWNGQAIENSRQFLLLQTDISKKTAIGFPWKMLLLLLLEINKPPEGLNRGFTVAGKIIASKEANSAPNPNPNT